MAENANTQFFDRYSFSHAALGAVFEASRVPAVWAIGSHIAFEAIENNLKLLAKPMWPDNRPDAWQNHVGDVLSFTAGYYGTRALKGTPATEDLISGFVGVAAAIWMWNVLQGHTWGT